MAVLTDLSSGTEYHDRYEYPTTDGELWLDLFAMADSAAGERLATTLEIIRNTGATLEPSDKYGYIIRPVIGDRGWQTLQEYENERARLVPFTKILLELLGRL